MKYIDDFVVGATDSFGSYHMSQEEVIEFATRFDPQPFHIDEAAGAAHPLFKKLAASGWHTAAATMRMIVDHAKETGAETLGSPGLDQISWPMPTYPGDTLHVTSEVMEMRASKSRPDIGFVKVRTTTFNQNDEVVMTFTASIIAATRAG